MNQTCFLCQRIADIKAGTNPYFVMELETAYVVLGDFQCWRGYTLLLSKYCKEELHELDPATRSKFLAEMALVAEAVCNVFKPAKLNYEMLGNLVPHMHWHLFPRYADDPNPQWPVWSNEAYTQAPRRTPIEPERLADMRARLQSELSKLR